MKTESINRTLEGLFLNVDLCTSEDYSRIDTLVVTRTDYDGSLMDVDYNELKLFPKLFNLTIDNCMIDNDLINILCELPNLRRLIITNCDVIENISDSFNKLTLFDIYLCNTNFDVSWLRKDYKNLKFEAVPFKPFTGHCNTLNVYGCEIKNVDELLNINFDEIIVSDDLYNNNRIKFDEIKKTISLMEKNGQFFSKRGGF